MSGNRGFTLVELAAVIAIIGLLYAAGVPVYEKAVIRARESALLENLKVMRQAIDQYYRDNMAYPEKLEDLVEKRYLRRIPDDPLTGMADWGTEPSGDELQDIYDVRSLSSDSSLDGTSYSEW
ncbi:MAG: prepilin-type N-terminal cleavage/methylation domain-containing protein [Candidatus Wallbacteria bacterium]|nr:prepilin-type N-terminal cleavage/methylation domain-containing protein [Candidatus Wallbacteria bacterium]